MKLNELSIILSEKEIIDSFLMEMANLTPTNTGLPVVIWLGPVGGQHGPRIKISNNKGKMTSDSFVMSVSKSPKILTPNSCKLSSSVIEDISDWIMLNYEVLMQLYEIGESGDGDMIEAMQKLKKI